MTAYLYTLSPAGQVLFLLAYLWLFWGLYVLVMGLYRAFLNKRLGPVTRVLGAPFLAIAVLVDFIANMACTVVFFDLPHEFLVTQRFKRYIAGDQGWRKDTATWVCENLLDPFDPTNEHC